MLTLIPDWRTDQPRMYADAWVGLAHEMHKYDQEFQLIIVNYIHNLHSVLNANGLADVTYWSAMDAILGIRLEAGMPTPVSGIAMPTDAVYSYGRSAVNIFVDAKRYATIQLNDKGAVWRVDYFPRPQIETRCLYDDRGFKIKETDYRQGKESGSRWYNEFGEEVLEVAADETVTVAAQFETRFYHKEYAQLLDLTREMLSQKLRKANGQIIATADSKFLKLLEPMQYNVPMDYFLSNENVRQESDMSVYREPLAAGRSFLVAGQSVADGLNQLAPLAFNNVRMVDPFDVELTLGHSNDEDWETILWLVSANAMDNTGAFLSYLKNNETAALSLLVNARDQSRLSEQILRWLLANLGAGLPVTTGQLTKVLTQESSIWSLADDSDDPSFANSDQFAQLANFLSRVQMVVDADQNQLNEQLFGARVLVDLDLPIHTYVQSRALAVGIPQINQGANQYVIPGQNGWLASNSADLIAGLDFFLTNLHNWNAALVDNVRISNRLTNLLSDILQGGIY